MAKDMWIQEAINAKNKGVLRKKLKVKKGEKIPESKLKNAEKSKSPKTRNQANLAETLRKMHHKD